MQAGNFIREIRLERKGKDEFCLKYLLETANRSQRKYDVLRETESGRERERERETLKTAEKIFSCAGMTTITIIVSLR